jgi:hypothetical protein
MVSGALEQVATWFSTIDDENQWVPQTRRQTSLLTISPLTTSPAAHATEPKD